MKVMSVSKECRLSIVFLILFAALALTLPVQTTAADHYGISEKNYSNYEKLQQIASSQGKVKIIVKLQVAKINQLTAESNNFCVVEPGLKSTWGGVNADMALMDAINFAADNVMYNLNGTEYQVNRIYSSIPYMALEVSEEALAILQDLPEVLDIEEDKLIKLIFPVKDNKGRQKSKTNTPGTANINDLSYPMLDNTVSVIGADKAWTMGYTGSGWYVAILDTGIRKTHKFFKGKSIVEACFAVGYYGTGDCPNGSTEMKGAGAAAHYPSSYSGYDHGTHVAGIAAGNNGSLFGVAKNADIIAVQIFSKVPSYSGLCEGYTSCVLTADSDVLAGLDYIYSIRGSFSIAAVNMSLGGGEYTSSCNSDSRKDAIDNLRAAGIATVISTGNDGYCGKVGAPACISSAISVGASTDSDKESYFNNWHSTLQKLFAPGSAIYSSTGESNSSYDSWNGTSMAAPHVAGAWALMKQAKPSGTVSQFLSALQDTGVSITSVCDGHKTPIPRIQVDKAIDAIPATITVASPNGGENWTPGSTQDIQWTSDGAVGKVKIQYSTKNGSSWSTVVSSTANDGKYSWTVPDVSSNQCLVRVSEAATGTPSDTSDAVFTISSTPPDIALDRSDLYFTAIISGSQTGSQEILVNNSGGGILKWSASDNASWLTCTPTSGTNSGVVTVSVNSNGLAAGSYTGVITISAPDASNPSQTVNVYLTVKQASQDQPPFGDFATPVSGSTVYGSIPVTGWVLDDVEVLSVKIYNGSDYFGDAVFVKGARPDVEQAYPGYPKNYRAGWGYMLLTNFLPNQGNGTYIIHAKAVDSAGKQITLGSKTIKADNNNAVKPFGAIDTPTQGGTASGSAFANWGWALTPQPKMIPTDGSTINVYVDGINIGHPTYNKYRSDIATLLPGYANSNGAVGLFSLDTTAYENGVHTIQWTATDDQGVTDGIGSRYFTIQNSGNSSSQSKYTWQVLPFVNYTNLSRLPVNHYEHIHVKTGYDKFKKPQEIYPDDNGYLNIQVNELGRLEIHFSVSISNISPLPIGSRLDAQKGVFYWGLGPGFIGDYELLFVDLRGFVRKINITVVPK